MRSSDVSKGLSPARHSSIRVMNFPCFPEFYRLRVIIASAAANEYRRAIFTRVKRTRARAARQHRAFGPANVLQYTEWNSQQH
jgi:DNA invertase Pin-like site-specific DNA recombinase